MYPNAACLLECSVEKVAENSEKSQLSNEVFKFFVKIKKTADIHSISGYGGIFLGTQTNHHQSSC